MKIDLDEIGDGAVENAVGEVSGSAAEEKSEAGCVYSADAAARDEQPDDDRDDNEGTGDKDYTQGGRGQTGEKTEGDSWITGVDEIKKTIKDWGRKTIGSAGFDPGFGGTVEKNDGQGEPEEAKARRKVHEVKEAREIKEVKETGEANILGHSHACRSVALDFGEGFGAALADGGVAGVFANVR